MQSVPLGYNTACNALALGRAAFFGGVDVDLPENRSPLLRRDDLTPQFGYVGARYAETRVLLLGINPGNGKQSELRSVTDERMMPALVRFAEAPSPGNFTDAQRAYKAECETWHVWQRHCNEVIGAGQLSLDQVAYSNCLPWRTSSGSAFSVTVAENAAKLYAGPLIDELRPSLIIAIGKRSATILSLSGGQLPYVITWNRAQAATQAVLAERAKAAAEVFAILGR